MDAARRAAPRNDPRVAIHGSGRPLALVPGLDGTGLLFYRQVPLLARPYRVITYALLEDASGMEALVEQLRRVVDLAAPDGGKATIVGESFGGALALSFELTRPTTRRGYLSRLRILREYDVRARLAELRVPSLFLASDRDHLVPSVREAAWMAARAPAARLRVLAGHGHVCLIAPDVDLDGILATWQAERGGAALDDDRPPAGSAGPCTSGT